jgi:toxin ParE1/3/4
MRAGTVGRNPTKIFTSFLEESFRADVNAWRPNSRSLNLSPASNGTIRDFRRAMRDLDAIWLFVARDNQTAANRLMDRLTSAFRTIASQPRIGRTRPELGPKVRSFPLDDLIVFYEIADSDIRIIRVWDGRQDPASFAG